MMLEAADRHGIQIDRPNVYWPVDGTTAIIVLLTTTVTLLVMGMVVFSRTQYHDSV